MKRQHFLMATAILATAMASCTADEELSRNTTDGRITYSVAAANQTRAAHSFCNNEKPASFNLWADYAEGTGKKVYIDGDQVNRIGTTDEYQSDNVRYWPEDDNIALNFYAYVDADGTFKYNNGAPKFENFTVKQNAGEQLDLMYATNIGKKKGTDGNVALNFRHALSQVCFKALNENENIEITVNSVSLTGIAGTGTYNLPTNGSTTDNYENHTDEEGDFEGNWNLGEWDDIEAESQNQSYKVDGINKTLTNGVTPDNLTCFGGNGSESDHVQSGNTKSYSKVLNLIPQSADQATKVTETIANGDITVEGDGAFFTLNLTIKNILNADKNKTENTGEKVVITTNKDFYVPADIYLSEGDRYIYTFIFSSQWNPDGITPITYTVNVDDFYKGDDIDVDEEPIVYKKILMREAYTDENGVSHPDLYFADRNVGASSPEDPGLYFAWGDTKGVYYKASVNKFYENNGLSVTLDDYYKDYDETTAKQVSTLFNDWYEEFKNKPGEFELPIEYDAARKYMGENWRIPTFEEIKFFNDLDFVLIALDGTEQSSNYEGEIKGIKVSNKDLEGAELFLPVTGFIDNTCNEMLQYSNEGIFRTNTLNKEDSSWPHTLYFYVRDMQCTLSSGNLDSRYDAVPIRAVWTE